MNKKEIILIGGGGHCKSCIEVIESNNDFKIAGIVGMKEEIGNTILGYKIIGCDADLSELRKKYSYALISVGQIKTNITRKKLFSVLKKLDYKLPIIVSKSAIVSEHSKIEEGTIIMHQVLINADVIIGYNCIINSKSLVEHECKIGNNCHISTGTKLNGNVVINNDCFIGSNSTIINGVNIVKNTFIGAGSLVLNNISKQGVYYGQPISKLE